MAIEKLDKTLRDLEDKIGALKKKIKDLQKTASKEGEPKPQLIAVLRGQIKNIEEQIDKVLNA